MRFVLVSAFAVVAVAACSTVDNASIGAELEPSVAAFIACDKRDQTIVRGSVEAAWERAGGIGESGPPGSRSYVPELVREIAVDEAPNAFNRRCTDVFGFATTGRRAELVARCESEGRDVVSSEIDSILDRYRSVVRDGGDLQVSDAIIKAYCAPVPG